MSSLRQVMRQMLVYFSTLVFYASHSFLFVCNCTDKRVQLGKVKSFNLFEADLESEWSVTKERALTESVRA